MKQNKLQLRILEDLFTIHRFPAHSDIPPQVFESKFYSLSRTEDELSLVCSASIPLDSEKRETDWSCIEVVGPLDFSLTGILADISAVLAEAGVSIFAISTFNTDYILVKNENILLAQRALLTAGYLYEK